jgi:dTDP-4-dehydrorhamnose reductase
MSMRLAVTGINGQVASALKALESTDFQVIALGRPQMDLTQPSSVMDAIRNASPNIVISSAAYTAVDKAESERDEAFAVNCEGARAVAEAARELGIPVIHISTDYVFDGLKSAPYTEIDPTGPTSVYGRSKLAGEQAVAEATSNHVILRTAWVYSIYGNNFVKTMLRLATTRDEVGVVADQFGSPTSADDIAQAVANIAQRLLTDTSPEIRGVFHLVGSGETTWAGFAKLIFSILKEKTGKHVEVREIATSDYPTPARRPANSRLDCSKLQSNYNIRLPLWEASTQYTVEKLLTGDNV